MGCDVDGVRAPSYITKIYTSFESEESILAPIWAIRVLCNPIIFGVSHQENGVGAPRWVIRHTLIAWDIQHPGAVVEERGGKVHAKCDGSIVVERGCVRGFIVSQPFVTRDVILVLIITLSGAGIIGCGVGFTIFCWNPSFIRKLPSLNNSAAIALSGVTVEDVLLG